MDKTINNVLRYALASYQLDKIYEDLGKWCVEFNDINYNRSKYLCEDALDLLCRAYLEIEKARTEL